MKLTTNNFGKFILAFVFTTVIGCENDFEELEVNPNQLSLNVFFDTPEGVDSAVKGIYGYFTTARNFGVSAKGMHGHHRSDEMSSGSDYSVSGQRNLRLTSSFYTIREPWALTYTAALQASSVIENADNADYDGNTALRDAYVGEAHMLRAFAHYFLLIHFRNIPILGEVPDSEGFVKSQAAPVDVWNFIISDLQAAKSLLPDKSFWDSANTGRMTSGAAAGLLGKVYLTMSGVEGIDMYTEAAAEFNEIITGVHGSYDLTSDYLDNFGTDNENNIESIFEFQFFGDGDENTGFNPGFVTSGLFSGPRAWAPPGLRRSDGRAVVVHDWVYDAFVASIDNDGRTDRRMFGTLVFDDRAPEIGIPDLNNDGDFTNDRLSLNDGMTWEEVYFEDETFGGKVPLAAAYKAGNRKWLDWNLKTNENAVGEDDKFSQSRAHGPNLTIIRYADVLLMYAEAVLMGGTQGTLSPLEAVNIVRMRANVPLLGSVTMTEIETERILELTNEGVRGIDLLRWGTLAERMAFLEANDPNFKQLDNSVYQQFQLPKNLYLPIPIDEIQSNPEINVQNPGW
ncbi:MAG: RagB/SusD family nutrient uptake outer membrane protein [Allomuricauda sp.]